MLQTSSAKIPFTCQRSALIKMFSTARGGITKKHQSDLPYSGFQSLGKTSEGKTSLVFKSEKPLKFMEF